EPLPFVAPQQPATPFARRAGSVTEELARGAPSPPSPNWLSVERYAWLLARAEREDFEGALARCGIHDLRDWHRHKQFWEVKAEEDSELRAQIARLIDHYRR